MKEPLLLASGVPRGPPFSRTGSSGKRYKERRGKDTRKAEERKEEGSNTPEARGPGNIYGNLKDTI